MINAGEAEIVVAGGMESMTQAPYLLPGARAGYRIGDGTLVDSMMYDGLFCAFDNCAMGLGTERYNGADGVSRERQDAFSALSHERAAAAIKDGKFADEIVPVSVPQRKGDPLVVDTDEGVRPGDDGRVAGQAASRLRQERHHHRRQRLPDLRRRRRGHRDVQGQGRGARACPRSASWSATARWPGPIRRCSSSRRNAISVALAKAGLTTKDIDIFEINEAFAAVGCASADDLGISEDVVNVNGGAIALGHPVGMSGTRVALTSLFELKRRGGGTAAVSLCGGGGQGDAAVLRTL